MLFLAVTCMFLNAVLLIHVKVSSNSIQQKKFRAEGIKQVNDQIDIELSVLHKEYKNSEPHNIELVINRCQTVKTDFLED